jgi:hypothetical protein
MMDSRRRHTRTRNYSGGAAVGSPKPSCKRIVLKGTFETHPSDYSPTDELHLRRRQLLRALRVGGGNAEPMHLEG